jgi:hypothetical protein
MDALGDDIVQHHLAHLIGDAVGRRGVEQASVHQHYIARTTTKLHHRPRPGPTAAAAAAAAAARLIMIVISGATQGAQACLVGGLEARVQGGAARPVMWVGQTQLGGGQRIDAGRRVLKQ